MIVFLVSYLGNHSLIQDSEYLYLCFLKESWVLVLIFKSLIHFEYIFVLVESFCPSIICWHYFTVYLSWNSCWRSVEIRYMLLFFGLSFPFVWTICLSLYYTTLFWLHSFVVNFENGKYSYFLDYVDYSGFLVYPYEF